MNKPCKPLNYQEMMQMARDLAARANQPASPAYQAALQEAAAALRRVASFH